MDPNSCDHLVALFFEGENVLSDPPDPGELAEQPSEAGLRKAFGEDYDLAMEMQSEAFTGSPSEELRASPLLRRITESSVIEGRRTPAGWGIGRGLLSTCQIRLLG